MKPTDFLKRTAVLLAVLGLLTPVSAQAEGPAQAVPRKVQDVALANDGVLRGQVVDPQGIAQAHQVVAIQSQQGDVRQTKTDAQGNFAVNDMKGGYYAIATDQNAGVYRLWANNAAPPQASRGILIVNDGSAVRGELPGPFAGIGLGPILIIGAAVAIGVAAATSGS